MLDPADRYLLRHEQEATVEMIELIKSVTDLQKAQSTALALLTDNTVQHTVMNQATMDLAKRVDYLEGIIHELLGAKDERE